MKRLCVLPVLLLSSAAALALPSERDRVYTADQSSNTVSVIDPASNTLLGQIRLGNPRPDVLSPLYRGEVNVHGLGFSPDHKTLVAVSTVTNSVTFIDTATNKVKGIAYIGRNPHEAFFTPDGKQVWAVVRGEDHLAVIDPATFKETGRIRTTSGPGMVIFSKDGKLAFVCNSFNPVVEVVDVAKREVIKKIPVVSPFSPFIQVTPDGSEVWLTHKDVGKVTRIDTKTLEVKGTIDTGPITNHLAFGDSNGQTLAYVTIGGENAVKGFTVEAAPKLVRTIPVGALPHGIWASGDGSRIYVGLENGDAVDVIDAAKNDVIARVLVGQAPQALVFVPDATDTAPATGAWFWPLRSSRRTRQVLIFGGFCPAVAQVACVC
jgi:YVTN family beta-propeller protein